MRKTPKSNRAQLQVPQKTAKARPLSPDESVASFTLQHADKGSTHAFHWKLTAEEALIVMDFLHDIGGMTWAEIKRQRFGSRPRHHSQPVGSVCKEAQERIVALHLDEVIEELFRFRLGSTRRLWGFVIEGVFHALWWDPDHQVYPTEPSS